MKKFLKDFWPLALAASGMLLVGVLITRDWVEERQERRFRAEAAARREVAAPKVMPRCEDCPCDCPCSRGKPCECVACECGRCPGLGKSAK